MGRASGGRELVGLQLALLQSEGDADLVTIGKGNGEDDVLFDRAQADGLTDHFFRDQHDRTRAVLVDDPLHADRLVGHVEHLGQPDGELQLGVLDELVALLLEVIEIADRTTHHSVGRQQVERFLRRGAARTGNHDEERETGEVSEHDGGFLRS